MHTFLTSWLPNIVCTVSGCVVSWAIGYSQGSVARRTLANLLHLQARAPSRCPGVARKGKTGGSVPPVEALSWPGYVRCRTDSLT